MLDYNGNENNGYENIELWFETKNKSCKRVGLNNGFSQNL